MTTAHRPTWTPAIGGTGKAEGKLGALSKQYSVRDQAAHTKLKVRRDGQDTEGELAKRDFKAELEERERLHFSKRKADEAGALAEVQEQAEKRLKAIEAIDDDLDADDPVADDDSGDDSDSDDEAELLRELQKIKSERAAEAAEKEAAKAEEMEQVKSEVYMKGNPLLNQNATDFAVARRWDDDVVFKNCAKKEDDAAAGDFVNDTLRSAFHRRFMSKYVR
mmetsp:Transcript_35721/g.93366  ORF Transcript_35721/g.93366 Transcript_35721/m.93366 type:complete len:221 (-) Transcript_35721:286-948(-)